jgi:hypothetical protein
MNDEPEQETPRPLDPSYGEDRRSRMIEEGRQA